ncbi:protein FAM49B-like [Anneissia japonica]|uniref:protein FAM49B-like n=1 Tax=Anneissia japonica TaxID=1529436 RepID=UPI001425B3F9|nr:protein FAM49B-like [Anneissia japonica]
MGNLLKILAGKEEDANRTDFFLDFENATPTEEEQAVWDEVKTQIDKFPEILDDLRNYQGAGDEIREAISNPRNEELQEIAWRAVCPLVTKLKTYYDYSCKLEHVVEQLLSVLCSDGMSPTQHLETQQALAKQFAEILHYTLTFDDLKMTNPAIQNDFSYYRRTLNRKKMVNQDDDESELAVSNEMANRMSLFYAQANPMLNTLSTVTARFVVESKSLPVENTTDLLHTMATVCKVMIDNRDYQSRFQNDDTLLFCLRVMVGSIILFDHVHPVGAFDKRAPIDIRGCIKVLKDQPATKVEGLLNALRYTTKHLNDPTTPERIKTMLEC